MTTGSEQTGTQGHRANVFDIRTIIAGLFAVYGVILTITGIGFTSEDDIAKAAGVNINLWGGIGMLIFAALMAGWAQWRPIIVPDAGQQSETPQ